MIGTSIIRYFMKGILYYYMIVSLRSSQENLKRIGWGYISLRTLQIMLFLSSQS